MALSIVKGVIYLKKIIASIVIAAALIFTAACENTVIAQVSLEVTRPAVLAALPPVALPQRQNRESKAIPAMGFLQEIAPANGEEASVNEETEYDENASQNTEDENFDAEYEQESEYTEDDLYWLARVIQAEAGGAWMPDWFQQAVGSVVLNRRASGIYPDSIEGVIFDAGQYHCVENETIYHEPGSQALQNAAFILENGSTLPPEILGQSEFVQGEIYRTYTDEVLGSTTYFCYM